MAVKDQLRVDREFKKTPTGRLFFDSMTARITDLSNVRILACSVDTVRQLYRGLIRPEIMCLFDKPGTCLLYTSSCYFCADT